MSVRLQTSRKWNSAWAPNLDRSGDGPTRVGCLLS